MSGQDVSMTIISRVTGVDQGRIGFTSSFQLPDGLSFERTRSAHDGVLYGADSSGGIERTFTYSEPPAPVLRGLTLGETAELPVTETIVDGDKQLTAQHQFSAELLACGRLKWAGGEEPVRVYRVRVGNARISRDGQINGEATDMIVAYVAPRIGWPLRREYSNGTRDEVLRIASSGRS